MILPRAGSWVILTPAHSETEAPPLLSLIAQLIFSKFGMLTAGWCAVVSRNPRWWLFVEINVRIWMRFSTGGDNSPQPSPATRVSPNIMGTRNGDLYVYVFYGESLTSLCVPHNAYLRMELIFMKTEDHLKSQDPLYVEISLLSNLTFE